MKFSGIATTASVLLALAMVNDASAARIRGAASPIADAVDAVKDASLSANGSDRALSAPEYDYDAYHNQGCRTHSGDKGVQGHDYDLYEHLPKEQCEDICNDYGDKCKAYEYGTSGRCEIWFKDVPRTGHADGVTCYVKQDDYKEDYYYYNNHNKACSTQHGGKGEKGKDYFYFKDYDCADRCDKFGRDCKAYESGPDGHCEIWTYLPPRLESSHGFNCAFKYY